MHTLARLSEDPIATDEESIMPATTLDVRSEPPARRHELIFATFAALARDEAFELVNDHDPKPLYYQFEGEQTGRFSWEYLEEGPQVWRIRIGRTSYTPMRWRRYSPTSRVLTVTSAPANSRETGHSSAA